MVVDQLTQANKIKATEENLWSLWERFGRAPGCKLHVENGALWFDTQLTQLPYNGVLRFCPQSGHESLMDRIFAHYQQRGVPFMWVIHPTATPANLSDLLERRGMVQAEVMPGMTMDLNDLPPRETAPAGFEIREVTTLHELAAAQELIVWRWDVSEENRAVHLEMALSFGVGQPGSLLRCWVAYVDGKPVSKALLNLGAGVAGIHGVATKPEVRGRGLARTLALEALHAAHEMGYRLAMLHSSPMARNLYEKVGFRQVSEFRVFVAGAAFHV